tara:strand:- start:15 stop:200 length:186 start_codon:yes stop_codon:yes gene_type:complete
MISHTNIQKIEDNRPRKCLGFKAPKDLMNIVLAAKLLRFGVEGSMQNVNQVKMKKVYIKSK